MTGRDVVFEHVLEPGTGKAVPVLRGQILRIEQLGDGQCADFNAFNLHDYKEYFHTGRTRHLHGLFPKEGDMLWSAPPRERPMFTIIRDTVGTNDVLYPRCTGFLYEYQYGFERHTNCHDILAESIREYGLTPDDVHDSFNFWMHTGVDQTGHPYIKRMLAAKGDYVELIAHFDILAVPNVCGADIFSTSNFELKPLKLQVLESTPKERERFLEPEERRYRNQRTPADFKQKEIRVMRELERDASYVPEWPVYPIVTHGVEVELADEEYALVDRLRANGAFGQTDGAIVRHAFFSWWIEHYMQGPKHLHAGE
ncbi:MAG TPA: urea carboxylase-associated family protein [Gaiellaceae bacterium]|nr:urea carboxylase-associated family protein [Gaiellaceae bacterium]